MLRPNGGPGSLYQRALGDTFDRLPSVLIGFHEAASVATAEGTFRITRGRGIVGGLAATLMQLPCAGEKVSVRLEVSVEGEVERWIRYFGAQRLVTRQWIEHGLLIEAAGPLRFGFRLSADEAGMRFEMERCWLLGMPLPKVMSPQVGAVVTGHGACWIAAVEVHVPLLGRLVRYEGEMIPQC